MEIQISVQTLSGMLPPINLPHDATVRDLKMKLQNLDANFEIRRQKLWITDTAGSQSNSSTAQQVELLSYQTLESYHITNGTNVVLILEEISAPNRFKIDFEFWQKCTDEMFIKNLHDDNIQIVEVDVDCIKSREERLFSLLVDNRAIQEVKFYGFWWSVASSSFCLSLATRRPDVDINLTFGSRNWRPRYNTQSFGEVMRTGDCFSIDAQAFKLLLKFDKIKPQKSISIQNCWSDEIKWVSLARNLSSMQSLTHLDFCGNEIGGVGCLAIANALQSMTSLQAVNWNDNDVGDIGCCMLAPAIQRLSLQSLELSGNGIGVAGCRALVPMLRSMTSLQKLNLSCNSIASSGCAELVPALQFGLLQSLNLSSNRVGSAGCAVLAPALTLMTSLQHLNLSCNHFADAGCAALAPGLKSMTWLKTLDLSSNLIHAAGCSSIAPALQMMSSLEQVNLSGNYFGVAGITELAPILMTMQSLEVLQCSDDDTDSLVGCEAISLWLVSKQEQENDDLM